MGLGIVQPEGFQLLSSPGIGGLALGDDYIGGGAVLVMVSVITPWWLRSMRGEIEFEELRVSRKGFEFRASHEVPIVVPWSDRRLKIQLIDFGKNPAHGYASLPCLIDVRRRRFRLTAGISPEAEQAVLRITREAGLRVMAQKNILCSWHDIGAA